MRKCNIQKQSPIENYGQGMQLFELVGLTAAIPYAHFSVAKTILKPGAVVTRHYHQVSDEFYVFVHGAGKMTVDGDSFPVAAGDVLLIEPNERHELVAVGDEDLEFFAITRPAYSPDDFLAD